MVCHFQVPHVEVKMQFQSTCKTCMFFQKNTFFSFFQNDTEKQFQNCSIQKKMIKIERIHYKRKILSLKVFSKKSKLTSQFVVKVFRFPKISHFAPKTAKIAKNTNYSNLLMAFLRRTKWFSEKNFRDLNSLFSYFLSIFYFFIDF